MVKVFDGIGARIGTLKFVSGNEIVLLRSEDPDVFIVQETMEGYWDPNMGVYRHPYSYRREIGPNAIYEFCSEYFNKAPANCSCEFWVQRYIVDQRDQSC